MPREIPKKTSGDASSVDYDNSTSGLAGDNVQDAIDEIAAAGGGGQSNTASNVGVGGVGVFKQKNGVDLEFKNINAGSSKVTISDDAANNEVDVDINEANIDHQNLSGAGTNTHAQIDSHIGSTSNPHSTDIGNIGSGTLAELNTAITDATLDDSGDSRPPSGAAGGDLGGTYPNPTVNDGADGSAIHDDTAGEIAAITLKGAPVSADVLLIEDSADSNNKKRITVGSLPTGGGGESNTGSNVNVAGVGVFKQKSGVDLEFKGINAGSSKISVTDDVVANEIDIDVVEANIDVANTTGTRGGVDGDAIHDNVAGEISAVALKAVPVSADVILIEDSAALNAKKRITVGSLPTGGGGEANTGSNVGTAGVGVFKQKTGVDLEFKKINAGSSKVSITDDALNDEVDVDVVEANLDVANIGGTRDGIDSAAIHDDTAGEIAAVTLKGTLASADLVLIEDSAALNAKKRATAQSIADLATGEANTVSNVGTAGVGVFKQKTGVDFELKKINAGSSKVTVTDDVANDEVDIDVVEANLDVANIGGTRGGIDSDAIHDNVAGEITAITLKGTPVNADILLIEDSADLNNKKRITVGSLPGGGGGLTSIDTGQTIWVDAANGNDGTGTADRQDLPFATIAAAIAASASGDLIRVRGGTYAESGLTLPAGVDLQGDGWGNTLIGTAAAVADIIEFSSSILSQFTVICPSTASLSGLVHNAGTGGVYSMNIAGDGSTGAGNGIYKTGAGKLIGGNIRCETGGLTYGFLVDSSVLALDDVHFPNTPGATISAGLRAEGTGRYQGQGFNVGNTAMTDAVSLGGTSTVILYNPNIFNVSTAVHITADGVDYTSTGGAIQAANLTVEVDPLLTGTGTTVEALATVLEPLFSFPPAAAVNTNFVLSFQQLLTDTREARQRIIGSDLALGFPELGSGLYAGKGAPYVTGMLVFTSDGTDTSTTVGGNLTDESAAASSLDASTFTFQGTAVNHCIYVGSGRRDGSSNPLKHWGAEILTVVAGVGGSYVVEIWDGAGWSEVGTISVGAESGCVYGNDLFIRAASSEDLRFGVDDSHTWATTIVSGQTAYWARVRIATTVTTLPTFERWRLMESTTHINETGKYAADGLAQWTQTLVGAGNVFASGGTATDGTATVGTGAGTWTHDLDGSKLNGNADSVSTQFVIPSGVNTAFGLTFKVSYEYSQYNAAPTVEGKILGVQRQGVLIADPTGGLIPVPRTEAGTTALTATAGDVTSRLLTTSATGKVLTEEFGPYDISDLYAGDIVLFNFEMTADGGGPGNTDIQIWAIEVDGKRFAFGELV